MSNVIWLVLLIACFLGNWAVADATGRKLNYFAGVMCGVAAFVQVLSLGGFI